MAERNQQTNGYTKPDEELATSQSKELKRKKRIKLAIYIAIFAVFQIIVITVFGAVIMRAKSPKLRLSNSNIEFQSLNTSGSPSPSFDINFTTQVRIKNPNFGPYKFDNTTAVVTYGGTTVGLFTIPKSKAGFKSTKKIDVSVNLSSSQLPNTADLGRELTTTGTLTLGTTTTMNGKVELMWIMKKKKSANMDCTMIIDTNEKKLRSLECK
ncbi:uncharacterized protein LOC133780154 [Humulus lupulus]|uniref:uncharacterized protein LOC133780154 n=1 Tax=Humulus lupulus TaxID=3486 RepID=UPI002B4018AC|nr:uncharacterized protein LOC133780154 [Humulus lupulus]